MITGPKQHFIPQALLRLFRVSEKGKARVHVYKKDRNYISSTADVAEQRFFYSRGLDGEREPLDTTITRHEDGPFGRDFFELVSSDIGTVDPQVASRVVVHLSGRGDHLRSMMRSAASEMGGMIGELFGSSEGLSLLFGVSGPMPGARFKQVVEEFIAPDPQVSQSGIPLPIIESIVYMMLREKELPNFGSIAEIFRGEATKFSSSADDLARRAHIKSLSESLVPSIRVDKLSLLSWRIVKVTDGEVVLPDFVVLARNSKGEPGLIFSFDGDDISEIIMPLGPVRVLVGQSLERDVSLKNFNSEVIPLCNDFFVSSYASFELRAGATNIGRDADTQFRDGVAQAAEEFRAKFDNATKNIGAGAWRSAFGKNARIIIGSAFSEKNSEILTTLENLAAMGREDFCIDRLFDIVVDLDYAKAIASVDRGRLGEGIPLTPSTEVLSLAYNVLVERDGNTGIVIVLHPDIVEMIISSDNLYFSAGSAIFLSQIAKIGCDHLLGTVFSSGFTKGEAHDNYILSKVILCWSAYIVAEYVCMFNNDSRAEYQDNLIQNLKGYNEELISARRGYRLDFNVDNLIDKVIPIVARVLYAASCVAATVVNGRVSGKFLSELEDIGWKDWFILFCKDISSIWIKGSMYPEEKDFFVLSRHVQRLLVPACIFLWSPPEGGVRVEVPLWSDSEWLKQQQN